MAFFSSKSRGRFGEDFYQRHKKLFYVGYTMKTLSTLLMVAMFAHVTPSTGQIVTQQQAELLYQARWTLVRVISVTQEQGRSCMKDPRHSVAVRGAFEREAWRWTQRHKYLDDLNRRFYSLLINSFGMDFANSYSDFTDAILEEQYFEDVRKKVLNSSPDFCIDFLFDLLNKRRDFETLEPVAYKYLLDDLNSGKLN
jgi:hypothetical protein